jgi:hypothetical protein
MIHDAREWQAAMQALLLVAEQDGPTMFARIGVMRALHRLQPKVAQTRRKRARALQNCAMKLIFKHGFNFHSGTPYRYS